MDGAVQAKHRQRGWEVVPSNAGTQTMCDIGACLIFKRRKNGYRSCGK